MPVTRTTQPRIALIGLGNWGRHYLRIAMRLEALVVACHTRHEGDDAAWLAERYPAVKHTTSLAEALDYPLDGVAIVTPRDSHAALIMECLRRGIHVLVEKPAVTTLKDLEDIHAEARERGLVLQTGYTHCFDKSIRALAVMARHATAPDWQFTWVKPAPGSGPAEIIWEYFPHVLSIAELMGGLHADQMALAPLRIARGPSGAASVEVDLPMRAGSGRVKVSTAGEARHKSIQLRDGREAIGEWSDRRLLDLRRNRFSDAREEPLACQIRSFLNAIASPRSVARSHGLQGRWRAIDRTVTSSLVALSTRVPGLVSEESDQNADRDRKGVGE